MAKEKLQYLRVPSFDQIDKILSGLENADELIAHIHIYTPDPVNYAGEIGVWHWYGIAYDNDSRVWWGWVSGVEAECGHFSIDELVTEGFAIAIDIKFNPKKLKDIKLYRVRENR